MAKRAYSYRITVEQTATPSGEAPTSGPLVFETTNHDDIILIAGRITQYSGLAEGDAASIAIGVKLLSEVMLKEKDNPLFDPLRPAIRPFVANLKALNPPKVA